MSRVDTDDLKPQANLNLDFWILDPLTSTRGLAWGFVNFEVIGLIG